MKFLSLKKLLLTTFIVSLAFFNVCVAKPLYIEISGGDNLGIPLTVLPFSKDTKQNSNSAINISDIIRQDLRSSGQFKVVGDEEVDFSWQTSESFSKEFWRARRSEYLVTGKVTQEKGKLFDIEINIFNVFQKNDEPITTYRYKNQNHKNFRALAHHISDKIFEKLIGVPGIFSTRIAYITVTKKRGKTMHTLTVADSDGFNYRTLVSANYPLMSPSWSPDGKKIAYVSFKNKRSSIKVVNLNNAKIKSITSFPGINGAPAWSPDGKKLALVLSKTGHPKIYIADLLRKKLTRLTSGSSIDTEPFWAPNGNAIYFTSNRGGRPQIYKVDLNSIKVSRVTFAGTYNVTPSVTPDGKNLVMMHKTDAGKFNIAVQSLETGKVKLLSQSTQDESPTLAPNGMMVLYGSRAADRYILGAVSLDGRFHMRLPLRDGSVKDPAWSPYLIGQS